MSRQREALMGERGGYLAQNMVGAIISLFILGIVASGIIGISQFQKNLAASSSSNSQAIRTDSSLRSDLMWASSIDIQDDRSFTVTVPGAENKCRVSQWDVIAEGASSRVVNTVTTYPGHDASSNPIKCVGPASGATASIMIEKGSSGTAFQYRNNGGRALTFTRGVIHLDDPGAAPVGITDAAWASETPLAINFDTQITAGNQSAANYSFGAYAPNIRPPAAKPADGPSHFVQPGSLQYTPID